MPKKKKAKIEKKVEKKETKKAASTGKSGEKSFQVFSTYIWPNKYCLTSNFCGNLISAVNSGQQKLKSQNII